MASSIAAENEISGERFGPAVGEMRVMKGFVWTTAMEPVTAKNADKMLFAVSSWILRIIKLWDTDGGILSRVRRSPFINHDVRFLRVRSEPVGFADATDKSMKLSGTA